MLFRGHCGMRDTLREGTSRDMTRQGNLRETKIDNYKITNRVEEYI